MKIINVYKSAFSKESRFIKEIILRSPFVIKLDYDVYLHLLDGRLYSFSVAETGDCVIEWLVK